MVLYLVKHMVNFAFILPDVTGIRAKVRHVTNIILGHKLCIMKFLQNLRLSISAYTYSRLLIQGSVYSLHVFSVVLTMSI